MSDKTEQPTPKKLRDARKKGQVVKSREIGSTAIVIGVFVTLWVFFDSMMERLEGMITLPTNYYDAPFFEGLTSVLTGVLIDVLLISLPIVILAMVLGVIANYFQVGVLFSFDPVKPDLKKINPASGIKKIFSMNNLIELLKNILKIVILSYLIYIVLRHSFSPLLQIPNLGLQSVLPVLGGIMKNLVIYSSAGFFLIAVLDYMLQKKQHVKKLKMTKDEVKREYKEMEGDPIVKGKRKQLHREMAMDETVQKTKKSSVVVTNPERLAIALLYEKEKTPLPVILAKADGILAKRMIEVAREEGIPIMRNVPLARELYEHGEVDQYIPTELIEPVAEVLKWVQQLSPR